VSKRTSSVTEGTIAAQIERYLRTGEHDPSCTAWPGNVIEAERRAHDDLLRALVQEVRRIANGRLPPATVRDLDLVAFTRQKVTPMVDGLFPRAERAAVMALVERSVVFLTPDRIEQVLLESDWLHTAWDLANLYLASVGAELLAEDAPRIVGLSQETTCYVSTEYFEVDDPFADFVVHEAAHIFHSCKRLTVGLPETRRREWLLDIEFRKRETFAYACEAYARIVERARGPRARADLGAEYGKKVRVSEERVDAKEIADIVLAATAARNGWKVILARCAAPPTPR
jgi:hypothetical protein